MVYYTGKSRLRKAFFPVELSSIGEKRFDVSRSIIDYFAQNYTDLLALSVGVCGRITAKPEAGEEVLHQVALTLCKKQRELQDVRDYGAYIAVCIRRAAINYAKREAHAIPMGLELMEREQSLQASDKAYDYMEWVVSLEKELQRFDPLMRKAFIAHYVDDEPIRTLAAALGISEKALSLRFIRMRKELKHTGASMFRQLNVLLLVG